MGEFRAAIIGVDGEACKLVNRIDDLNSGQGAVIARVDDAKILHKQNNCIFFLIYTEGHRNRALETAYKIASVAGIVRSYTMRQNNTVHQYWEPASVFLFRQSIGTEFLKFIDLFQEYDHGHSCEEFELKDDIPIPEGECYIDPIFGENVDDGDDDHPAPDEKPSQRKRKKISKIKAFRQKMKNKKVKPFKFVKEWWKTLNTSNDLSLSEIGAAAKIYRHLNFPYVGECWPGEKSINTSSTRKTWIRNRDGLERKGWIIVENFGPGTSPIIYPTIPGRTCPSKFAPKQVRPEDKKGGIGPNLSQNDTG